jgi:RNA polymerase sigma-70 factor (ECF subfamily)
MRPTEGDGALVRSVLKGDIDAFSVLVHRYSGKLINYVQGRIGDQTSTDDIVQETFLRAYQSLRRCTRPDGFANWLFEIARNCIREWARERKRNPSLPEELEEGATSASAIQDSLADVFEGALSKLPQEHQRILIMKYEQGMSCKEIAEALNAPLNTITKQLSRAYEELEKYLKKEN